MDFLEWGIKSSAVGCQTLGCLSHAPLGGHYIRNKTMIDLLKPKRSPRHSGTRRKVGLYSYYLFVKLKASLIPLVYLWNILCRYEI